MSEVSKLSSAYIVQGKSWIERPHYEEHEQFLCSVEGVMTVKLVAHVYRQEIMAGKMNGSYFEHTDNKAFNARTSPLNLFRSRKDFAKEHPHWTKEMMSSVDLGTGDCIFIPAYYFFQTGGFLDLISNQIENDTKDIQSSWLENMAQEHYAIDAKSYEENGNKLYDTERQTALQLMYQPNSDLLRTIFNSVQ